MKPKVFGIGLSRTGTTSLNKALQILGWNSIHFPRDIVEIAEHEAATDLTVAMRVPELVRLWPDAKFVYTWRERKTWLKSCEQHFSGVDYQTDMNTNSYFSCPAEAMVRVYGSLKYSKTRWNAAYHNHERMLERELLGHDNTPIIINICDGQGWETLCPFLGVPIPDVPFPHENKS